MPGPPGEKGETGDVGQMVRTYITISEFSALHYKQYADLMCPHKIVSSLSQRVHLAPLVPEDLQDPQEPMALRDLLVVLETPVLLEKK